MQIPKELTAIGTAVLGYAVFVGMLFGALWFINSHELHTKLRYAKTHADTIAVLSGQK